MATLVKLEVPKRSTTVGTIPARGRPDGWSGRLGKRGVRRPALEEVAMCVAELEAAGQKATGDALAARLGVSDRTGRRMLVDVRSPAHLKRDGLTRVEIRARIPSGQAGSSLDRSGDGYDMGRWLAANTSTLGRQHQVAEWTMMLPPLRRLGWARVELDYPCLRADDARVLGEADPPEMKRAPKDENL